MQKNLLLAQSSRGLPLPLNAIFDTPTFRTREATCVHCTLRPARDFALLSFRILPCVPCIAWPSHLPLHMSPQAVRAITRALEFKGFGSPRFYRPLRAAVMAHATYRHELRAGMRAYITRSIRAVTPFLVPKTSASFAKHPHVSQLLFNHKDSLRAWAAKNPPRCCCGQLRQWAPDARYFKNTLLPRLRDLTHPLCRTGHPQWLCGQHLQMFEQFSQNRQNWCRTSDLLGPPEGLKQVFAHSYAQHQREAQSRYRATQSEALGPRQKHLSGIAKITMPDRHFVTAHVCTTRPFLELSKTPTSSRSLGNFSNNDLAKFRGKPRRH